MAKVFLVIIAASLIQWIDGAPAPQLRHQQQLIFHAPPVNPRPVGNLKDLTDRLRKTMTSRTDYHASSLGNPPLSHPVHPKLEKPLAEPPLLNRSQRALPYASFHCQEQVSSAETDPLVYRNHRMTSHPRSMNCSLLLPYLPDEALQTSETFDGEKVAQDVGKAPNTFQLTPGSATLLHPATKNQPVNLIIHLILPSSEDSTSTATPSSPSTSSIRTRPIHQRRRNVTLHAKNLIEESKVPAASALSFIQRNSTGRRFQGSTPTPTDSPRTIVTGSTRTRNVSRFRDYAALPRGLGTQTADFGRTHSAGQGIDMVKERERGNSSETLSPNVTRAGKRDQVENLGEMSQSSDVSKTRTANQVTTSLSPRTRRTKPTTMTTSTTTTTATPPELELVNEDKESDGEEGEENEEDEVTENTDQGAIRRFHEAYEKTYREVQSFIDEERPLVKDMFETEEDDNEGQE